MFKSIKKKMKDQKGFTLIELLAVIVILGIIAAIAIPAIGNVIQNSKNKATVSDAQQIIDAAKLYYANENVTFASNVKTLTVDLTATPKVNDLDKYLDKVKDDKFVVTITKDATSGKISYTIQDHEAAKVLELTNPTTVQVSEQQIVDYLKK